MFVVPSRRKRLVHILSLVAGCVLVLVHSSLAQETGELVRVSYVAGQNVYLSAGRDVGIVPGDSVGILLADGTAESALVRSAMRDRSVLVVIDAISKVNVGDNIRILANDVSLESISEDSSTVSPGTGGIHLTEREMPVDERRQIEARQQRRSTPRFEGRLMLGLRGLRSETSTSAGSSVGRLFMTPWAAVRIDGRDLPFDLAFRTRLRGDYRYSNRGLATPDLLVRAYELLVERDFATASVMVGRFSNRFAVSGGYWDGVLFEYGPGDTGIGFSGGFLPERSNGAFSTDSPKLAVFGNTRHSAGAFYQRISGWYQEIYLSDTRPTRRNLGFSHRATVSRLTSNNRLELDRDPESGTWMLTRGSFQLTSRLNSWLGLRGRYEIRQPYSMYRSFAVISYRRDQISAGASLQFPGGTVSGDVVLNYSYRLDGGRDRDGQSVRLYAGKALSPVFQINATGSYWTSANGNSSLLTVGATRSMGRIHLRANYQLSHSTRFDTDQVAHLLSAGLAASISRRIRTISDVRVQAGSNIFSVAFNTTLSVSL